MDRDSAKGYLEDTNGRLENFSKEIREIIELIKEHDAGKTNSIKLESRNTLASSEARDILASSCFVMLYSSVESTYSDCRKALEKAIQENVEDFSSLNKNIQTLIRQKFSDENNKTFQKIIKFGWKINIQGRFELPFITSYNVSEKEMNEFLEKIGTNKIEGKEHYIKSTITSKRELILSSVKDIRNRLSHGELSFQEFGRGRNIEAIEEYFKKTQDYLQSFIKELHNYIEQEKYRA